MKVSKLQKLLVGLSVLLLVGILGCAAFQDAIIPCVVHPDAITYADANVPMFLPYTTIADAKIVNKRMDYMHSIGRLKYEYLKGSLAHHLANAEQFKATVFSPEGPIGLLLPTLAGLGIGAFAISKPSDKKEIEKLKNGGQHGTNS